MKKEKVRYGVIGLGHIAQVAVLPAFRHAQNSELAALISGHPKKLKALGKQYKVPEDCQFTYDDYPECLKQAKLDALYICLPNHMHLDATMAALREGVHVLCEKPLATSTDECDEMIRLAEETGLHLMTAYRLHFERANLEAVKHAQEKGTLGDPRIFSSVFTMQVEDPQNIRLQDEDKGGGPVWDIGIYCINAARALFRAEPEQVFAHAFHRNEDRFKKVYETVSVILRFPEARVANFVCSFGAADSAAYDLIGMEGRLHVDNAYEYQTERTIAVTKDEKTRSKKFRKADQFSPELIYFSNCILKGAPPAPSGYEGRADVRVIEAIYRSLHTGAVIELTPGPERAGKIAYPSTGQLIERPGIQAPREVNESGRKAG